METFSRFSDLKEQELARLAHILAPLLKSGDILALKGDLGTGKSVFARALIRTAMGDETLDVPSPTYTLIQPYQPKDPYPEILHADLYRIENPAEIRELGLEDFEESVLVVEWPEKMAAALPPTALWVHFTPGSKKNTRHVSLKGPKDWEKRLQKVKLVRT